MHPAPFTYHRATTVSDALELLQHGVATLPRGLMYLSTAHDDAAVEATLSAITASIEAYAQAMER